ncbi:type IV toxin-antitoxin system AbiEi family antitoxin [Kordiimonas pumila]|uniref:Type IV toxin-antitoxin system AbiEi family antitoxin n=2 Tax=Kordiimonas pumila TaxID=2161677 RepID=A0ABV7D612_9PROT
MSTNKEIKINKLLQSAPHNTVWLASWLADQNISHDLQQRYVKSGWLEKVGTGAFKRKGEKISWLGGVYAVQKQAQRPIHIGGMTALRLQGFAHYLRSRENLQLFSPNGINLPRWFTNYKWDEGKPILYHSSLLSEHKNSFLEHNQNGFDVTVSSPERAILEAIYLTPKQLDMVEVYQTLEGLANLRPKLLEKLLEECTSIKVKRLFLFMAKKAGHQWADFINTDNIDLGTGNRSLSTGGVFISDFKITIPKELAEL